MADTIESLRAELAQARAERDALRAKNKELGGIAHAATDALGRLSFECFGLIEPCERPSVATYNSTYATLVECRKRLADAAIDAALDAARALDGGDHE